MRLTVFSITDDHGLWFVWIEMLFRDRISP